MRKINVALLGFGTVGKGVYDTIHTHQDRLKEVTGASVHVSAVVIENPEKHIRFKKDVAITTDFQSVLDDPSIDVIFEAIVGSEPAFPYLAKAIQSGKHIITANKEMFAHHGATLTALAKEHHVEIGLEATTAGGIPIIQTIKQLLQVNRIKKVTAILNGTSNYILTEMREKGLPFTDALQDAQNLGYAEADPTNDIEGYDAFYKLMILSECIFGKQPKWETVERTGIQHITIDEINKYERTNERIKHVATIEVIENELHAKVEPTVVSASHPLFAIEGVENAVTIETDIVGQLTLKGPGAGALPTASAMLEDFCTIITKGKQTERKKKVAIA